MSEKSKDLHAQVVKAEWEGLLNLETKLREEKKKLNAHLQHILVMKAVLSNHSKRYNIKL